MEVLRDGSLPWNHTARSLTGLDRPVLSLLARQHFADLLRWVCAGFAVAPENESSRPYLRGAEPVHQRYPAPTPPAQGEIDMLRRRLLLIAIPILGILALDGASAAR